MPNCINGKQSISLTQNGKLVFVVASVQAANVQSVQIADSSGKVVFKASGKSSSGGVFTEIGSGTFKTSADGIYKVILNAQAGILAGESSIVYEGSVFLQTYTFITNDEGCQAGDKDFNDLCVSITCFGKTG
jgi:hypothetical protein